MSIRVVFDIGHGADTWPPSKGVYLENGGSFAEHEFNYKVAMAAKALAEFNGIDVFFTQQPNSKDVPLNDRGALIKSEHDREPFDCLLSFHANANSDKSANGYGVLYWHTSTLSKKLAEIWNKNAKACFNISAWGSGLWESKPNHWSNMYILRTTPMPAILMEHFFFTNPGELAKCNTPEFIAIAAEVAVKTVCEFTGVGFRKPSDKQPVEPKPVDPKNYYRVQTGAFKYKANADAYANEIKSKGFDIYMVEADGYYKVQVGAYEIKANADAMEAKLKAAGYPTFITTKAGKPATINPANTAPVKTIKVGSKVSIAKGARSYSGDKLAAFVYNNFYTVMEIKGDRVVVGQGGGVTAAIRYSDLVLQD
jgi:N-acetylmuramoyl-L-alanine amidase